MSFLTLDVGTTGCKAIIFDLKGRVTANSYREYPLTYPKPGWIELNANLVWVKVKECIKEVLAKDKITKVKTISVSSQGEAFIPVNKKGDILYNSIVTFDNRAEKWVEWWDTQVGRMKIFEITGMPLNGTYTLNKILWFRENRPKIFAKTWKFLCYEDFIFFKMGLPPIIDYSLAAKTMGFDIHRKCWSKELLRVSELDENVLSETRPSGEFIGKISRKGVAETGLPVGTRVITGGHDQAAGVLGAGVIEVGQAMDATGTTESIAILLDKPILNNKMLRYNYPSYPCVIKDKYMTVAFNFSAGSLLKWYRDNFAEEEMREAEKKKRDVYELILEEAQKTPTNIYILPHFTTTGTPYLDPYSKGAIIGLTLSTKKTEIIRALLEGITFEMKLNLKYLSKAGINIAAIRAVGGGAKSKDWLQLKANMFNRSVTSLQVFEAPCLGVAILSAVAMNEYDSIAEAVAQMVKAKQTFKPDPEVAMVYEEKLKVYEKIYNQLSPITHQIR